MFDKSKYDQKYMKENYYHMSLMLPKEYKDLLARASEKRGLSRNAFVRDAIDGKMKELGLL